MAQDQGLEFIMSQSSSHGSETAEDRATGTRVSYVQAAVMDIIAVLLFALLARIAHNSPELPFSWGGVLATAWPFLLGAAGGSVSWPFSTALPAAWSRLVSLCGFPPSLWASPSGVSTTANSHTGHSSSWRR